MALHPLTKEQQDVVDGYRSSNMTIDEYASSIGLKKHQKEYLYQVFCQIWKTKQKDINKLLPWSEEMSMFMSFTNKKC